MNRHLPDIDVWMVHHNLQEVPRFNFPQGYSMRFFRDGELPLWLEIQHGGDSLFKASADDFHRTMPPKVAAYTERVMFLEDPSGKAIGSVTAWNSSFFTGEMTGHVHWVAILEEAQGKGLATPMVAHICHRLSEMGFQEGWLETNTRRIPALNLYLKLGFKPYPRSDVVTWAWNKIAPELKYPI